MASFIVCEKCSKVIGAQEYMDDKKFKIFEERLSEIEKRLDKNE